MTSTVADHYAKHLGPVYSWMVGDFDAACAQADSFYSKIRLPAGEGKLGIDLGCGHGVHSVPLARRGYRILAIDTCTHLLNELQSASGDLPISTVASDISEFKSLLDCEVASLITCMGDTVTHLPSIAAVESLIRDAALSLAAEGLLTLSFRDYSTKEIAGTERFIPVRSDEHRIHICFLEYRPDTVLVHDIIHSLVDTSWQTTISAYPKIRLHPETLVTTADSHGLSLVHRCVERGMHYFAFRRSLP